MKLDEYSTKIHLKSNEVARKILEKVNISKDFLISDHLDPTPAEKKEQEEKTIDFGIDIIKFLATEGVTVNYATFGIDKIIDNLTGLKQYINGTLGSYEDEFLSRSYGVKNDAGKYRKEEVTISDLMIKLAEIQKSTGDNQFDFINEVAPELPVDDEQAELPSPFQDK